jgi:hypothetical protein
MNTIHAITSLTHMMGQSYLQGVIWQYLHPQTPAIANLTHQLGFPQMMLMMMNWMN